MNWTLLVWYQLPVFIVFGLFAVHRFYLRSRFVRWQWVLDAVVIVISASRTLTWFLPLSGHALFLTYAIGTSTSWPIRIIAFLVLIEVIAIKHFWLYDDSTPWAGIGIGLIIILIRVCTKTLIHT